MEIKVGEIVENPDGSATVKIDMDQEALKAMAHFGVLCAIKNSLSEVVEEEVDTEVKT